MGLLLVTATGCRLASPIAVWAPAQIQTTVGQKLVLAPVSGPPAVSGQLHASILAAQPKDPGRQLTLRTPKQIQSDGSGAILLASATELAHPDPMSDLTLLALSKQANADWLLMGEIIQDGASRRRSQSEAATGQAADPHAAIANGRLSVVWRLYDVKAGKPVIDHTMVIDTDSSIQKHPDLAGLAGSEPTLLTTAAGREVWSLLAPNIRRTEIEIAQPWGLPGSRQTRQANELAAVGRWPEATSRWEQVLSDHPRQHAAQHNLAIAAVAAQDFSLARERIHKALRQRNSQHYRHTATWIETRQREYYTAFGLPTPSEGWAVTNPWASEFSAPREQ
ncbi:hypothetical protein FF011L_52580 [Roseimaritima multifibrata]|uniref:Tetratricopeptide repeat protein n=1 Tax=Roseimaritima multifibrata TaxID=1930274 RepID=A0A517MNT9_9BACT|nr:hypothetical protein FF011L_52580 [Roseimaritima multifibrata]